MTTTLVLSVIGNDRAGLVKALADVIEQEGGNWERSHLSELAGKFAGIVVVTVPSERAEGLRAALEPLQGLLDVAVDGCIISSTVPRVVFNLRVLCNRYFDTRPLVVGKPACLLPVAPRVDFGTVVGPDRLVNTVGAFDRHGPDLIVVDFGTATTFDVVDDDGAYVGGVIAPGVNLSLEALHMVAEGEATVEQIDGYRFVYTLPFAATRMLLRTVTSMPVRVDT